MCRSAGRLRRRLRRGGNGKHWDFRLVDQYVDFGFLIGKFFVRNDLGSHIERNIDCHFQRSVECQLQRRIECDFKRRNQRSHQQRDFFR